MITWIKLKIKQLRCNHWWIYQGIIFTGSKSIYHYKCRICNKETEEDAK